MKVNQILAVLVGTTMLGLPLLAAAQAQKVPDLGKREYDANCAVCHGVTGKGDGPYPHPMGAAADLTVLAKKNGGVFPFQAVYEYVDGTKAVTAHGPRAMPIWGDDYMRKARNEYRDENYMMSPYDPYLYTRTRILALTEYIYRLQVK
jgi:mono/diheme cytochrome c family protein